MFICFEVFISKHRLTIFAVEKLSSARVLSGLLPNSVSTIHRKVCLLFSVSFSAGRTGVGVGVGAGASSRPSVPASFEGGLCLLRSV